MVKRSKAYVENELNEIFKLLVVGATDLQIKQLRKLPESTYRDYYARLADRIQQTSLAQSSERILFHKEITKERIMKDRQVFQQVMSDSATRPHTRVEAARADLEANVVLFKLENETTMYVSTIRKQQTDVLRLDAISANLSEAEAAPTLS